MCNTTNSKGRKSKLYQDLENKCVNNKPLTNILYGIAISKTFKEKYCKSKDTLDRLGEPTILFVSVRDYIPLQQGLKGTFGIKVPLLYSLRADLLG